jgi:hypothetical protein
VVPIGQNTGIKRITLSIRLVGETLTRLLVFIDVTSVRNTYMAALLTDDIVRSMI